MTFVGSSDIRGGIDAMLLAVKHLLDAVAFAFALLGFDFAFIMPLIHIWSGSGERHVKSWTVRDMSRQLFCQDFD